MMGGVNEFEMKMIGTHLSLLFFPHGFLSITKCGFKEIICDSSVLAKHGMR